MLELFNCGYGLEEIEAGQPKQRGAPIATKKNMVEEERVKALETEVSDLKTERAALLNQLNGAVREIKGLRKDRQENLMAISKLENDRKGIQNVLEGNIEHRDALDAVFDW